MNLYTNRYCPHCCYCCRGPKGDKGDQGLPGDIGPQGEPGKPFPRVYGTFHGNEIGPFSEGSFFKGQIIPVTYEGRVNTPGAFEMNESGSVTINIPGIYLITGRVLLDRGSSGNIIIQINERGARTSGLTLSGVLDGGAAITTTILALQKGDNVSNGYIGTNPISGIPYIQQVRAPSSSLTLVKIDDLDPQTVYSLNETDTDESIDIEI